MSTLIPIFTIGDLVQIDQLNKACVSNIRGETNSYWFTVRHCVTNQEESNAFQDRCRATILLHEATTRSGISRSVTPPPRSNIQPQTQNNTQTNASARRHPHNVLKESLKRCRK